MLFRSDQVGVLLTGHFIHPEVTGLGSGEGIQGVLAVHDAVAEVGPAAIKAKGRRAGVERQATLRNGGKGLPVTGRGIAHRKECIGPGRLPAFVPAEGYNGIGGLRTVHTEYLNGHIALAGPLKLLHGYLIAEQIGVGLTTG